MYNNNKKTKSPLRIKFMKGENMNNKLKDILKVVIIFVLSILIILTVLYQLFYNFILRDNTKNIISDKDKNSNLGENSAYENGEVYFIDNKILYKIDSNDKLLKMKIFGFNCKCIRVEGENVILFNRNVFPFRNDNFYKYNISDDSIKLISNHKYGFFETEMIDLLLNDKIIDIENSQLINNLLKDDSTKELFELSTGYKTKTKLFSNNNYIVSSSDAENKIIFDRNRKVNYLHTGIFIFKDDEKTGEMLFITDGKLYQYSNEELINLNKLINNVTEDPINFSEDADNYYFFCGSRYFSITYKMIESKIYKINKIDLHVTEIYKSNKLDYDIAVALMPTYYVIYKEGVLYKYDITNNSIINKMNICNSSKKVYFEQTANYLFVNENDNIKIINIDNFNELTYK